MDFLCTFILLLGSCNQFWKYESWFFTICFGIGYWIELIWFIEWQHYDTFLDFCRHQMSWLRSCKEFNCLLVLYLEKGGRIWIEKFLKYSFLKEMLGYPLLLDSGFLNPAWHEIGKQEKFKQPRGNFFKT